MVMVYLTGTLRYYAVDVLQQRLMDPEMGISNMQGGMWFRVNQGSQRFGGEPVQSASSRCGSVLVHWIEPHHMGPIFLRDAASSKWFEQVPQYD
jgi:hypothetical protein